jgi:uncharacterized protein (DUF486 family)
LPKNLLHIVAGFLFLRAWVKPETKFCMRGFYTICLLVLSNVFMTLAWYGHLKFKDVAWLKNLPLWGVILLSWGIALFEYMLQVPANRLGHIEHGGPFNLWQLKVLQEVITLSVFTVFMLVFFKQEPLRWNHIAGFVCLILAVYFIFKK